jgi:hypothetical protein
MATEAASGRIIMGASPHPTMPKGLEQSGSAIDAAGKELQEKNAVMAGATRALSGGGRRRRKRSKHRGGAEVKLDKIPNFVTAGGTDPKQMFAGLMKTADAANADAVYDKLGNAPAMQVKQDGGGGKRRRIKKSRKHNGRRSKRSKSVRKHSRTRRMSRRIRDHMG